METVLAAFVITALLVFILSSFLSGLKDHIDFNEKWADIFETTVKEFDQLGIDRNSDTYIQAVSQATECRSKANFWRTILLNPKQESS